MAEVIATDEFVEWFEAQDEDAQAALIRSVGALERKGVALGHPQSSAIKGSRYALRELRVQAQGRPLRVFYAFDPRRDAVLLIGGDKTGDERFYDRLVPIAERIWDEYLAEQHAGRHGE
jgi:hypothetical protein